MHENLRKSIWLEALPGVWSAAILAGLPHLLYALSKYVPRFLLRMKIGMIHDLAESLIQFAQRFPPAWWLLARLAPAGYWSGSRVFTGVLRWPFILFVLILVLFAWRRGWPRWSSTALGYGLLVLFEISLAIWRDDEAAGFSAGLMLTGYILLIVWLARRDPLAGLLSVLPLYPMFIWWTEMDGVQGEYGKGLYFIFVGLVMALVVGAAIRKGSLAFGLGAVVVAVMALGLGVGYAAVYSSNLPAPPLPAPGAALRSALGGLLALALISLPLWLTLGWGWARRRSATA